LIKGIDRKSLNSFKAARAKRSRTVEFWLQLQDYMAMYIGNTIAMRSGDWGLLMATFKRFGPIWKVFGHHNYGALFLKFSYELNYMPHDIIKTLEDGGCAIWATIKKLVAQMFDEGTNN
jgi:hypothetical protein